MKKLFLYGCGERCRILLDNIDNTEYKVLGVLDSDSQKWGKIIYGIEVFNPEILIKQKDVYVCVTFYSSLVNEPLWDVLKEKYGIDYNYQLTFHDLLIKSSESIFNGIYFDRFCEKRIFMDATWGLGLGGVESWIKDSVGYFENAGIDISLLTSKTENDIFFDNIVDFSYENSMVFSKEYISKGIDFIKGNMPCTIIFSRTNELLLAAYIIKNIYPDMINIIMVVHGSSDGMIRDVLSYRHGIDKYICVSKSIKENIISKGINSHKVYYMTVPIKQDLNKKRTYLYDVKNPIKIVYAGRIEIFEKRADIMLKLIQTLEHIKIPYEMNIAGRGSYYNNINDYILHNCLQDHIHMLGLISRENIPEFWINQDIAINVSDNEGRPISNMEAMLYGAVPVVTETMGILDDVRNGENGIIVPINDYKTMAEKIVYLSENRDVLKSMSQKASSEIKSKISMDKYISLWKSVLYD